MNNRRVFIINGVAKAGKDTFVRFVQAINCSSAEVINISSIDPINKFARSIGWSGEKDNKSRKFLAEVKSLSDEAFDFTLSNLLIKLKSYPEDSVVFYHVRERANISKIKAFLSSVGVECKSIYIERDVAQVFENKADSDAAESYDYDIVIENNGSKDDSYSYAKAFCNNYLETC